MKTLIVLLPLLAIALARPQKGVLEAVANLARPRGGGGPDGDAQILRNDFDNIGIDGYKFGFDTSNGISRDEQGQVDHPEAENAAMQVHGTYSYTGADGKKVTVTFVADENGFRPQTSLSRK